MRKEKSAEGAKGLRKTVRCLGFGTVAGIALFYGLLALAAFACLKWDIDRSNYACLGYGAGAVSAFAGGFFAVLPLRKNGMLFGSLCGVGMGVAGIIGTCAAAGNSAGGRELLLVLLFVAGAAVGGIAAANVKKKNRW